MWNENTRGVLPVRESGDSILGSRETGSHACYLVYGVLKPGERGRVLKPGHGHEEIILALHGDLALTGKETGILKQGQALHLQGEESVSIENEGSEQAIYVISAGIRNTDMIESWSCDQQGGKQK